MSKLTTTNHCTGTGRSVVRSVVSRGRAWFRVALAAVTCAALATVGGASAAVIPPECVCSNPVRIAPTLGGTTLTAGCYLPTGDAAWSVAGVLQLSGSGSFVFQTPAALNTATASVVSLIAGADCGSVHWCPTAAATLGSSSVFVGSITTGQYASITVGADAHVSGVLTPGNAVLVAGANAQINACGSSLVSSTATSPLVCSAGNTLAVAADLGGLALAPGCYTPTPASAAFALTGTLTLTGSGAYKFITPAAFDTAANSAVALTNGAACGDIFWSVGGIATLGANSVLYGTLQSGASAPINVGANALTFGLLSAGNGVINSGAGSISAPCGAAASAVSIAVSKAVSGSVAAASTIPIVCKCSNPTVLSYSDFGGKTVVPGCYTSSAALALTGTVTLSGSGSYVFISAGAITTAANSVVALTNGANCAQINFCVSAANIGASSVFKGNVHSTAAITIGASAAVTGALKAENSVVTIGAGAVVHPCTSGVVASSLSQCVPAVSVLTACGCTNPHLLAPELGSQILTAGCYTSQNSTAFGLTGLLSLNGPGAYTFSTDAALTTAASSEVRLLNGANCADITWCVGGAATFGGNSKFFGRVSTGASAAITLGANSLITGELHAGNGVITPGAGSVNAACPTCAAVAPVSSSLVKSVLGVAAPLCACSGTPIVLSPVLGGAVITPGCYVADSGAAFMLTGQLTLNGAGSYVFSTPSTLNSAAASTVALINGATCDTVQWCVGGAATLGGASIWSGSIVTGESAAITIGGAAKVSGTMSAGNKVLTLGSGAAVVPCGGSFASASSGALAAAAALDCSCTPTDIASDLGGLTVNAGCYSPAASAALAVTGTVTLSGSATDRFVFRTFDALNTAANSQVLLSGGAVCSNVVWCVASAATLGASSLFQGSIQITGPAGSTAAAGGAITIGAASVVHGSMNALTVNIGDAVTLNPCATPVAASAGVSANCGACSGTVQTLTSNDLGSQTLVPGCYAAVSGGAFGLTGTLTLSGSGVYQFSTPAALNTAANSVVALSNGASCDSINWCIGGAATLGATSTFNGQLSTLSIDAPVTTGDSVHMHGTITAGNGITNFGANTIVLPCGFGDFSTLVATPVPSDSNTSDAHSTVGTAAAPLMLAVSAIATAALYLL